MPAPCIINVGTIVHKSDMLRVLSRLNHVSYTHMCKGERRSQGTATLVEVVNDPQHATLLADRLLHLNISSFDYLELLQGSDDQQTQFVLVRGDEQLRLESVNHPIDNEIAAFDQHKTFGDSSLEFALAHIIAAKLDAHLDASSDIDDTTW
ncbi:MAG: hypothetical protein HC795_05050 [Coleofasciculaceae cyanobacterium RL_1_1]|nr:hypothetical protein [Coleofasciculaceae cyanobacterium RL_1_1]